MTICILAVENLSWRPFKNQESYQAILISIRFAIVQERPQTHMKIGRKSSS